MRPGMGWAGSQLFPLASHSYPSGRGPGRSARGCLCPQVTGANPGGCCGPNERRAGSQRSLAAASSPAGKSRPLPQTGREPGVLQCSSPWLRSHSPPPPDDVFWGRPGCDARPGVLSLPSWGFVLSWERGVHVCAGRGLLPCLPRFLWTNRGQS